MNSNIRHQVKGSRIEWQHTQSVYVAFFDKEGNRLWLRRESKIEIMLIRE